MFINDYLKITKVTSVVCKSIVKQFVSVALLFFFFLSNVIATNYFIIFLQTIDMTNSY